MTIRWNDSMSVGHPQIDSEHKRLIDMLNRLRVAVDMGYGEELIEIILCDLSEYCCYHFSHEEREMMQLRYSDYLRHKSLHDTLISKLDSLVYKFEAHREKISLEVIDFLGDWLFNHILIEDRKLVELYSGTSVSVRHYPTVP
ncbi:putative Bacteriohemerythrin [Azospirillaceae bacterium]